MDSGMLQDHRLWALWTWCLMKATHKPHKRMVCSQIVSLEAGQLVFGKAFASKELNIPPTTVYRLLKKLEKMGNIVIRVDGKISIVSIVNWDSYQVSGTESGLMADGKSQKSGRKTPKKRTESGRKVDGKIKTEQIENIDNIKWCGLEADGKWTESGRKIPKKRTENPQKADHIQEHIIQEHKKQEQEINSILPGGNTLSAAKDENVFLLIPLIPRDGEYQVSEKQVLGWQEDYPGVDVRQELVKIKNWNIANPKKRKTRAGILKHVVSWLGKAQDEPRGRSPAYSYPPGISRREQANRQACMEFLSDG